MNKSQEYYLLTWNSVLSEDHYITIYGPYYDKNVCSEDGYRWQLNNDDNPCWQVMKGPLDIKLRPQFRTL